MLEKASTSSASSNLPHCFDDVAKVDHQFAKCTDSVSSAKFALSSPETRTYQVREGEDTD